MEYSNICVLILNDWIKAPLVSTLNSAMVLIERNIDNRSLSFSCLMIEMPTSIRVFCQTNDCILFFFLLSIVRSTWYAYASLIHSQTFSFVRFFSLFCWPLKWISRQVWRLCCYDLLAVRCNKLLMAWGAADELWCFLSYLSLDALT